MSQLTNDIDRVSLSSLSRSWGAVIQRVEGGEAITLTRRGVPVAVITPVEGPTASPTQAREDSTPYLTKPVGRAPDTALMRLIGGGAGRSVLALFIQNPDSRLHQREVARRAGVGLRSAQLALEHLVELGILMSERDGNRLYFRAQRTERFDELRALLNKELGIGEVIIRHLKGLSKPVDWAFIFGSTATGEDTVTSDIDLVVVTEADGAELASAVAQAGRKLGREIDVTSYRRHQYLARIEEGNHFLTHVLANPRIDLIGGRLDVA